jgi:hypothetical protein
LQTDAVPPASLRQRSRSAGLLLLLGGAWALTPQAVPLYDGIGFPDEPYRYVPAHAGAPAATSAQVTLPVSGGVNVGGLIANSGELGPQVSVYAPPKAFAVAGSAPVVVAARPVAPTPPLPPGRIDSNVYVLSFTSAGGPVTLVPQAQSPALTLRSVSSVPAQPVLAYRPAPGSAWQLLSTRRIGRDLSDAKAPGAGEYVLVQPRDAGTRRSGGGSSVLLLLAATVVLMALVLLAVRLLSRRGAPPPDPTGPAAAS